jgi:transcriptional regulator with XRE-family HTH domain
MFIMTISGRQIRAARALLDLSREDLAGRCGVTMITIRNIEAETVEPQGKTLANISTFFDKEGVEFQDDEGVCMRKHQLRTFSGKVGYRQLLDHIYETVKKGGRIRQFNFGDARFMPIAEDLAAEHIKRMEGIQGLDARVLVLEGEIGSPVSYCSYRTLDETYKDIAPWYLYGDFLILPLYDGGQKRECITIHSKPVAERYMLEFDALWQLSEKGAKKGRK